MAFSPGRDKKNKKNILTHPEATEVRVYVDRNQKILLKLAS